MRGWILINLFLLAIVLIGAAVAAAGAAIVSRLEPTVGGMWAGVAVCALTLLALYFASRQLWAWLNNRKG